ncbi:glutamate receptor 1-like isoform X2 [Plodia interpunctella]|uniref:glutamate receptor 1-like isoform X2 n=1 Tax=Plodia interpunctella TaxID=58824 RepID=UPI002367CE19|nr:glutamate receptor 1-like isoform X2 [Plodia interpunctella]XP_053623558.1 glutamate receptor 1-like isoform X2 [Plodia interpunctella]
MGFKANMSAKRIELVGLIALLTHLSLLSAQIFPVEKIAVGAIFDQNTEEIQSVFKYALSMHNQNISSRRLELQAYVDVINTADAFKLSRLICNQFARGVFAMLGAVTAESFDTLHSYTNTFQMPFVTPWFPEKVIPPSSGLIDHAVSMRPDYHRAIVDTIVHYGWKEIIYMYDSHDGLLRLQQLYQSMQPGHTAFRIIMVKRINNATDAIDFLLTLEQHDRWGNKRIVLDCNTKNAKNILISHVRKVQLGRRTYHYMLSGLVMDDHWENEVTEYGAVNITGFRIVDHSRKIVRDFTDGLRRMDGRFKGTISAQTALMYDGVQVLMDALGRLWRKKPDAFRSALRRAAGQANSTKVIDCNPGKSWVVPFEHGDKISRLIKKTDIEGLTGNISFNDEGHRYNFTLQVVEMTVQSAMLKVATWSDIHGLIPVHAKYIQLRSPASYETNKTYIVTTMLQEPYMMQKSAEYGQKDELEGFCKDLMDLIAKKMGIKYELQVVKDRKYGVENPLDNLSELISEVVRKDADIALGPLAVTPDREKLVDFSEPFLSIDSPITNTKTPKQLSDTFSFLKPLSKEIWLCILFSFFAVSIVLFLVSRFSPHEWRSISISDTHLDHPISSTNEIILHNDFSIWNSFWFSLGSFMQQGSDVVPRSLSGRIVGTVWWFFALILVCSYTANLAAYLIVERIADPAQSPGYPTGLTHSEIAYSWNNIMKEPFVGDDMSIVQYPAVLEKQGCNTMARVCRYKHTDLAIATAKGSPLREGINLALVSLKKEGVIAILWRKWILNSKKSDCDVPKDEEFTITEMTLSQVSGIFYVLVGGLALALSVALLEFCQHGRAEAARANVPLRAALRAKARMASRTDRKTPPQHTPQRDTHDRLGWNGAAFGYNEFLVGRDDLGQSRRKIY